VKKAVLLLLFVACARRETPPAQGQARVPVLHEETKETTKATRVVVPKPRGVSTPAKCAGDGSYKQAVECFQMSSGFRFRVASPAVTANGTLLRPRIGEERVTIGAWSAQAKGGGIVWTRNGKAATPAPELERLYQRLTLWLDPQKKEGGPQLVDSAGATNHYHFTDANSGEAYDVFVAKDDGRIVRLRAGKTEIEIG
jgi:hypothetical protein